MAPWLAGLTGCVLAVSGTTRIDEPVDRVVVDIGNGDVRVTAGPGPIELTVDFGGISGGEVGHQLKDGVLLVDYRCEGAELCGGDLDIRVPAKTPVEVLLGAGDLRVDGLRNELIADVGAGEVRATFPQAPDKVNVTLGAGAITIALPPGTYDLVLHATGVVDVDPAVVSDPTSPHRVVADADAGAIDIKAR